MNRNVFVLVPVFGCAWLTAPPALAGIEACGDIHVEASAECEMRAEAECTASCEPIAFQASCSVELYAGCEGTCDGTFSAECTGSCQGSCEGECSDFEPGTFDCSASCEASCSGDCSARCEGEASGAEASGQCEASCKATCSGECQASCEGTPPSVDCSGQCSAGCEGQCNAEANFDCQVNCQAGGFDDCQSMLEGGCVVACDEPEGALFCDGQYIDHGGNLDECVAALDALLNIEVEGYAYGSSECSGDGCSAMGEAGGSVKCSVVPQAIGRAGSAGLGWLPALLLGVLRRRRR